jgi:hypothetical protein
VAAVGDLVAPIEAGLLDAGAILELGDAPTGAGTWTLTSPETCRAGAGRENAHATSLGRMCAQGAPILPNPEPSEPDRARRRVAAIRFGKDVCAGRTDSSGTYEVDL